MTDIFFYSFLLPPILDLFITLHSLVGEEKNRDGCVTSGFRLALIPLCVPGNVRQLVLSCHPVPLPVHGPGRSRPPVPSQRPLEGSIVLTAVGWWEKPETGCCETGWVADEPQGAC